MLRWLLVLTTLAAALALTGCPAGVGDDDDVEDTILLTVENRTGAQLWYFQYRACGASDDAWIEVIEDDEYVANGSDVSSIDLDPGCYDLYVEDEYACSAENSTDGNVAGGDEFIWTVVEANLTCP